MTRPAYALIHLDHLRHNYRLLKSQAGSAEVMAVVKANAYGHGLDPVAPCLFDEGCRSFAVTDAEEGARLAALLPSQHGCDITLLSGIFDGEDARLSTELNFTPVITEASQLEMLINHRFEGRLWIKVDTGMSRLDAANPAELIRQCRHKGIGVRGLMSHLACADTPEHPLNELQISRFEQLSRTLLPDGERSLLNSAGLFTLPDHRFEQCRPGIALYGSQPVNGVTHPLKPVMRLCGEVIQIRDITAGQSVSYGAEFVADRDMRIAVVSVGYGDGLPRRLSGHGAASNGEVTLPVTGRICMDYTMLDVSNRSVREGDRVEFWGNHIHADAVAASLGTISYELFTGLNARVRRVPV